MKKFIGTVLAVLFINLLFITPLLSQVSCPYWAMSTAKDNHLFLYYPTVTDPIFPEWGIPYGINTSPAEIFDVADLDPAIGTTAQLRNRITDLVVDDYCEFNVEIHTMLLGMTPIYTNWQIVGIGSDWETIGGGVLFGIAQAVDTNDSDPQDYARVWADSFHLAYPTVFSGANSTLERWANAIAGTVSHEAGHNYGLSHGNASPNPTEDPTTNHIMATGSSGLTGEMRATINRHFSDTSYEILGHNVGLNTNTLHNWDFTNPNSTNACSLRFKVLSTALTLDFSWVYQGGMSPWINPTITATGTTEVFHGTTYNVFYVEYSVAQAWNGATPGQVAPGEGFHIGSSFTQTNGVVVKETTLYNCAGVELPLRPRMIGYDAGSLDMANGDFRVTFFNPNRDRDLILRNLSVQLIPRMVDIETMMPNTEPRGRMDMPINVISTLDVTKGGELKVTDALEINIANLADKRHVDFKHDPSKCNKGYIPADGAALDVNKGEIEYCQEGTALSLFPSTYVYITVTVVDPEATYYDATLKKMVTGPLESILFYQLSGFVPDLNNNGQDDLLDIREGEARDENKNGVPDTVEDALRASKKSTINKLNR